MPPDRQKLEQVIKCAISVLYSEAYEFEEAVAEIVRRQNVSTLEAYVALSAAISTKDGGSLDVEEHLGTLAKLYDESDSQTSLLLRELCETKAKRDFLTVQMANMFLKIECDAPELSFGGAIYKAEKLKNGPLTREERDKLRARHLRKLD